ncbi:MAG: hypothetical protein A2289_20050 [Deltaproteobacteria bacterium RIFOXYA12_FULL_58_15]|nr:MAG: hypothetical protein A2289_20050 [Deltaproteobacteria bacterium RIFOXYA12_FULL_58_15]OGR07144.1 MAG: hypothetical protein A2341_03345 [Deltaproteobacteria bacterium RIFOXYB12_FULL_58_9]
MRSLTVAWVSFAVCSVAFDVAAATRHPKSSEPSEQAERIRTYWRRFFAPPEAHDWQVELGAGRLYWQRADGERSTDWLLRLGAHRQLREWGEFVGAAVALDVSWSSQGTAQLTYRNTQTTLTVGLGYMHWHGPFRLDAMAEAGGLLRTVRVSDGVGPDRHGMRLDFAPGASVGAVVALGKTVHLGARFGMRYQPRRLDSLLLLEVGWLVGRDG